MASQSEIARHLSMSVRTVQHHVAAGLIKKGMTIDEARETYIKYLRANQRNRPDQNSAKPSGRYNLEEERAKNLRADTELKTLRKHELERITAPIKMIEYTLGRLGGQIAAILDALPAKVKRRAPHLTAAEVEIIKREIVKAQNLAANVKIDFDEYESNR